MFDSLMEEAVFPSSRAIRIGKLRVLFAPDMKIKMWEFSIDGHCNMVPHRLVLGQVGSDC